MCLADEAAHALADRLVGERQLHVARADTIASRRGGSPAIAHRAHVGELGRDRGLGQDRRVVTGHDEVGDEADALDLDRHLEREPCCLGDASTSMRSGLRVGRQHERELARTPRAAPARAGARRRGRRDR